jgi:diaminopimelate decarboxylase
VAAGTHPHIATGQQEHKFGVAAEEAGELARRAAGDEWLEFVGIGCHIGSQITRLAPFRRALARMRRAAEELNQAGLRVRYLDIGGGVGIRYQREEVFRLADYARTIQHATKRLGCHLILEPGRAVVGPAGVLLSRVLVRKRGAEKNFLVLDAGMNDLLRPALYGARHRILPVRAPSSTRPLRVEVVGPICETSDAFAHDARLPVLEVGALVAICDVGAYGFAQASNYNSRPRPAEVLVRSGRFRTIRRREQWADLIRGEIRN